MAYQNARSTRGGGRSRASGEVLPGPRTWKASRANGEANRAVGAAWTRLEGAGHGGQGSESLAGGGAACSGQFPVIFGSAGLVSARGGMVEARGCFIGTTRCTGGRGPASACGRAMGSVGARTGVNRRCQPRSNTWNRCFCPCSNADWAQIFANLSKIAVKDLYP
jgi:hypothetical protein